MPPVSEHPPHHPPRHHLPELSTSPSSSCKNITPSSSQALPMSQKLSAIVISTGPLCQNIPTIILPNVLCLTKKFLPSSLPSIRLVPEPPDPHHSRNPLGSTNSPPSLPRQHILPAHILDQRPPPLRSSPHCTNSKTQKNTDIFERFSMASGHITHVAHSLHPRRHLREATHADIHNPGIGARPLEFRTNARLPYI